MQKIPKILREQSRFCQKTEYHETSEAVYFKLSQGWPLEPTTKAHCKTPSD